MLVWQVWKLLIAPAFYYAALWVFDTCPNLHKHILFSFSLSKQTRKPVLFYTGNKISINTVKKQGMQSASSLYPLAATFRKGLDSYTHRALEDVFKSKLVCQACESHQTLLEMDHVYSSPFLHTCRCPQQRAAAGKSRVQDLWHLGNGCPPVLLLGGSSHWGGSGHGIWSEYLL